MDSIGALLASHVHLGPIWPLIQTKWVPMAKWAILLSCDPFWHNSGTIRVNKLPCVAIMRPFGSIGSHIGPLGNDIKTRGGHIGTKWVILECWWSIHEPMDCRDLIMSPKFSIGTAHIGP